MGILTELRVMIYRRVLEITDNPIIVGCCDRSHHLQDLESRNQCDVWFDEELDDFWNCIADTCHLLRVNKTMNAEVRGLAMPNWELGICARYPVYASKKPCHVAGQVYDLAIRTAEPRGELLAITKVIKKVNLAIEFFPKRTQRLDMEVLYWKAIDGLRCLIKFLNDVEDKIKLQVCIKVFEISTADMYPDPAKQDLAEYISCFEELADHVEVKLEICGWYGTTKRDEWDWLPADLQARNPQYLAKLRGGERSKHFPQHGKWLLDEWNKLREWVDFAFASRVERDVFEASESLLASEDLHFRMKERIHQGLKQGWAGHWAGDELQFEKVKEAFIKLWQEHSQECQELLMR